MKDIVESDSALKKQRLRKRKNPKIMVVNEDEGLEETEKQHAKSYIINHQRTQSERSKNLCDEYMQGGKLAFTSLGDRLETVFDVEIEPYTLDDYFFKVITFKNQSVNYKPAAAATGLHHQEQSLFFEHTNSFMEPKRSPRSSKDFFPEEFPSADERKGYEKETSMHDFTVANNKRQSQYLALRMTENFNHQNSDLSLSRMTIPLERPAALPTKMSDIFAKATIASSITKTDNKTKQATSLELVKTQRIHHVANSVTSYATTGIHAIKTLKRVFSSGSTFPLARNAGIVSGILILAMVVLSVVFYIFSMNAIDTHQADTAIINGVNSRLDEAVATWQLITRMHLSTVGLGNDNIDDIADAISAQALEMLQTNNELDIQLSMSLNKQRLKDVYERNINLWEPCSGVTTNDGLLNTFQATPILYNRFFVIQDYPMSCIANASEDLIYAINNTGNDYLLASENLVGIARTVVEESLNTNIWNLEGILIGEGVTLGALCIFLFATIYLINQAYKKLFRALLKIEENYISFRVKQLKRIQKALDGDLEGKDFGVEVDGTEDDFPLFGAKDQGKKGAKRQGFTRRSDQFVVRSLLIYIIKYIIVACLFIVLPAGLFAASLIQSVNNFVSLDIIDDQLSVTSKLQYQLDLLTSNLYLDMMFRNETDIFIRNQETETQLPINLELVNSLHDQMIYMFFDDGDDLSDPIVRQLLTNTICSFLIDPTPAVAADCLNATDGGALGLIALELRYITYSSNYITLYLSDPTFDNADRIVEPYAVNVRPVLETLQAAYQFLGDHLLANSKAKVDDFRSNQKVYFIATLVTTVLAGFVTYFYAIRKFKYLDMGRGKILKMLPYNMITENKALDFYLKREFKNKNLQFGRR